MGAQLGWIVELRCAIVFERIADELQHCAAHRVGQCCHHVANRSQRLRQRFGDIVYRAHGNARLFQTSDRISTRKAREYAREFLREHANIFDTQFAIGEARVRR